MNVMVITNQLYKKYVNSNLLNANIKIVDNLETAEAILIVLTEAHELFERILDYHKKGIKIPQIVVRYEVVLSRRRFVNLDGNIDLEMVDYVKNDDRPYWAHLETHIVDYCNLNCKACNNFSPFVKGHVVASISSFKQDISVFSKQYILGRLFLLGGEPLIEPELTMEFIEVARNYFPNTEIRVLSNGLLVERMEVPFWKCMRDNSIILQVSVYPPTSTT